MEAELKSWTGDDRNKKPICRWAGRSNKKGLITDEKANRVFGAVKTQYEALQRITTVWSQFQ